MGIDAQMVFVVPNRPSADQLSRWSWDMVARLGNAVLYQPEDPCPVLGVADERPCGLPNEGVVIEVQLFSRHYGVGYERGQLLEMCAVAEWIEVNIADAVVYYGTDHHEAMWLWGRDVREELKRHFYGPSGIDYRVRSWCMPPSLTSPPTPCAACVAGEDRKTCLGGRGAWCALACYGCQREMETNNGGASWKVTR